MVANKRSLAEGFIPRPSPKQSKAECRQNATLSYTAAKVPAACSSNRLKGITIRAANPASPQQMPPQSDCKGFACTDIQRSQRQTCTFASNANRSIHTRCVMSTEQPLALSEQVIVTPPSCECTVVAFMSLLCERGVICWVDGVEASMEALLFRFVGVPRFLRRFRARFPILHHPLAVFAW